MLNRRGRNHFTLSYIKRFDFDFNKMLFVVCFGHVDVYDTCVFCGNSGADWEKILGKSYTKHQKKQQARLGRGKREKTQVHENTKQEMIER